MRDGVQWQIQHETKLSAVLDTALHLEYRIFRPSQMYCTSTDLLFYVERISSSSSNGSGK